MTKADDLTDDQLLGLVVRLDKQLFEEGVDIQHRSWKVSQAAMQALGHISYVMGGVGKPRILDRIEAAYGTLYRRQDLAMGGHIGVFMFRDIFARISVPLIFGRVGINPFDFVELTAVQLQILQHEPEQASAYLDQFGDVFDIQYGADELRPPFNKTELVGRFLGLSRLHLHAAAAILTGGYDYRGAVQSALLACELALKAGVAAHGLDEAQIKAKYGHDLVALAALLASGWSSFDGERVGRVLAAQPKYVPNRYAPVQPPRRDAGHLVMSAQYLVAEVVRQMSDRNFGKGLNPPHLRVYPQ